MKKIFYILFLNLEGIFVIVYCKVLFVILFFIIGLFNKSVIKVGYLSAVGVGIGIYHIYLQNGGGGGGAGGYRTGSSISLPASSLLDKNPVYVIHFSIYCITNFT